MGPYNGFTPQQRQRAQDWLNAQWKVGALARPCGCHACGQTTGVMDAHAEDYSEPFSAGKTDQFHLCFVCHMMVHCRFRSTAAWCRYRDALHAGMMAPPFNRDWPRFEAMFLQADPVKYMQEAPAGAARRPDILDEIQRGKWRR